MDNIVINIFNKIGINIETLNDLLSKHVERKDIMSSEKYISLQPDIVKLKKYLSSSSKSSLQNNAFLKQRFPLINLLRQILSVYNLKFIPMRKSNGYDKNGKKLYSIFYKITK